jgi:hypothetical protein
VGIAFAWGATNYTVGNGARMGPGYFPVDAGHPAGLIGVFITFEALVVETEDGEPIGKWAWKPLGFIIGSNVVFGICWAACPSSASRPGPDRRDLRADLHRQPGRRGVQGQGGRDPRHGAGHRQLPGLHPAAEAAVPRLAQLHHRLRGLAHGSD